MWIQEGWGEDERCVCAWVQDRMSTCSYIVIQIDLSLEHQLLASAVHTSVKCCTTCMLISTLFDVVFGLHRHTGYLIIGEPWKKGRKEVVGAGFPPKK